MFFNRRKRREAQGKFKLTFKTPVTFNRLERACLAIGAEIDRVIENPQAVLDSLDLTVDQLQAFCDAVLVKPPKLSSMPIDRASGIGYYVITDFFLHSFMERWKGRTLASFPSSKEQVGRVLRGALQ